MVYGMEGSGGSSNVSGREGEGGVIERGCGDWADEDK